MKKIILTLLLALSCTFACAADKVPARPHIEVVTTEGTFKLELDGKAAPLTVANFLHLVESGFYDGTIFHRIIPGFMAQGGGYTPGFKKKAIAETVANESSNGLSNLRGTIAMARTSNPDSATSQFFINVVDNAGLNYPLNGGGYATFGKVTQGMDVVDKIKTVETGVRNGVQNVPKKNVTIKSVKRAK